MKLATNTHNVSAQTLLERLHGKRSKVKVIFNNHLPTVLV